MPIPGHTSPEFLTYFARLEQRASSAELRKDLALELKDYNEQHRDPTDIAAYAPLEIPILIRALRQSEPSLWSNDPNQASRIAMLTIIERIPHIEALKPLVKDIHQLMAHLLTVDNEEIGIICMKITTQHLRSFKPLIEPHALPFVLWVANLYNSMEGVIERVFSKDAPAPAVSNASRSPSASSYPGNTGTEEPTRLLMSTESFKVLHECPVATAMFVSIEPAQPSQAAATTSAVAAGGAGAAADAVQAGKVLNSKYAGLLVPAIINYLKLQVHDQRRAHEEAAMKNEMWIGAAPGITNRVAYTEFLSAQAKAISFLVVIFRQPHEQFRQYAEFVPSIIVRLLKDCPAEASALRRELIIVLRHHLLGGEDMRSLFILHIDDLINERVLMGDGVTSQEGTRTIAYTTLADLVHQMRDQLSPEQLNRILHAYSCNLHMPSITLATQTLSMKVLVNLVDSVVTKCSRTEAARILVGILETGINKLGVLHRIFDDVIRMNDSGLSARNPEASEKLAQYVSVERTKPVEIASYLMEGPEQVVRDLRQLYITILTAAKHILTCLTKIEGPVPDAEIMGSFFEDAIKCLAFYEKQNNPALNERDVIEKVCDVFLALKPHVFQELWTSKFNFFLDEAVKHPSFVALAQNLLSKDAVSRQLVSIMLRQLVEDLDSLGDQDTKRAGTTLRVYKVCFMAATILPDQNEMALVTHIPRIMVDSFPLAAKSAEPMHYYLLLRALFRAIGGHKFDAMYTQFTALLQELLETLNRLLVSAPPHMKDLIVELTLTVPVRLTHLLPYLGHLMQPLVYALRAGPELVAQGLRTLELCIDNLTPEFLDPTLKPVLRDVMGALHDILRPLPHSSVSSHTTIRILGKLGGRNRRLQHEPPQLDYLSGGHEADVSLLFDGRRASMDIGPMCRLAAKTIRHTNPLYRAYAYDVLKTSMTLIVYKGCEDGRRMDVFSVVAEGMFNAIHNPEHSESARDFLRDVTKHIWTRDQPLVPLTITKRTNFSPIVDLHIHAVTQSLAIVDPKDGDKVKELVGAIVGDMAALHRDPTSNEGLKRDTASVLHLIASRFVAMCWEDVIVRKMAGYSGLSLFVHDTNLRYWVEERGNDITKALMAIVKDTPSESMKGLDDVIALLHDVIRICNPRFVESDGDQQPVTPASNLTYYVQIMGQELSAPSALVRTTAQSCITLLGELSGKTLVELLSPSKDRLIAPIYARPLRAMPLHRQTGHVEAITYCLSLRPTFIVLNEEFWRLLSETLSIADTKDDEIITQIVRGPLQRHTRELVTKLRVSCLRMITASINITEFFSGQQTSRSKVIGVYFKSLYMSPTEVKDAASAGLQEALLHQARLPKDLLHSGLMPILTNLADSKRLTLANLDGLGRLMDILTNHFKVELGSKLIDHHRQLADEKMLREIANGPLEENEEMHKLVKLADIFHRLPTPAGVQFLQDFTTNIAQSEAFMHSTTPTPFTPPLSTFYNKYSEAAVNFLIERIAQPRIVRTIRNVLILKKAPAFYSELVNQIPRFISECLQTKERYIPALSICLELARLDPVLFTKHDDLIQALLSVWTLELDQNEDNVHPTSQTRGPMLLLSIFRICIEQQLRLDILCSLIAIYTLRVPIDLSDLTRFLHTHVVVAAPFEFKRQIFRRFMEWITDPSPPRELLTQFARVIINPMIIVTYAADSTKSLLDEEHIRMLGRDIWTTLSTIEQPSDALTVEIIQMSGLLVLHGPDIDVVVRGELLKSVWAYMTVEDAILKQSTHLFLARFFKTYDSPGQLLWKVWAGLLRPQTHNEGRHLIRQAIDILAPVLPLRAGNVPLGTLPNWVKIPKRLLDDDSGGLTTTISTYRVIIRHADLFFPFRDQFIPHMIGSLTRLLGQGAPDLRSVPLEILEHILRWEKQRIQALADAPPQASVNESKQNEQGTAGLLWTLPFSLREACITFLVRLVLQGTGDAQTKALMVAKGLRVLRDLLNLSGWSDITVRPQYFERTLVQTTPTQDNFQHMANALKLLHVSIDDRSSEWIVQQASNVKKWLLRPYGSTEAALHDLCIPIITRVISALPAPAGEDDPDNDVSEFYAFANSVVGDGLRSNDRLGITFATLHALVQKSPGAIEEFATGLMKCFTKQCRDHVQQQQTPIVVHPNPTARPNPEPIVRYLKSILEICRIQAPTSGDARRYLINGIAHLVDKSNDVSICKLILEMCRDWVFNRTDGIPTMREKATILQKMICFEMKRWEEPLFLDYLNLIYDIYKEPSLRRTDLTIKLESPYLIGCRSKDPAVRLKFSEMFEESLPRTLTSRLQYVLGPQSWEYLAEHYWISQALELLFGAVHEDEIITPAFLDVDMENSDPPRFGTRPVTAAQLVRPMRQLLHLDPDSAHLTWVSLFTSLWRALSRREQQDVQRSLILLLTKEYHSRQIPLRRNVVQSLLAGSLGCQPPLTLPPFVVKYLGKTFNAWHISLELLQDSLQHIREEETVRDAALDALAELYAELSEDDMFYGLWRRRALYPETNIALSFEQNGLWQDAQIMHEDAQIRARAGGAPFNEQEYCLWEDHWILTAQKLQQWDTLTELANQESNHDLLLECAWRLSDWEKDREAIERSILAVAEVATPRRRVFEAFTSLIRGNPMNERPEFDHLLKDAMQLSLRKWISLPPVVSVVHVPLLQHFQQLVELQEAAQIFHALASTTAGNLEKRSNDLKVVLQAWRERLPNLWDDIAVWSDLVAWRQHVFHTINKKFLPLIPQPNGAAGTNSSPSTAGYRGYHEIAWIINRFAHVARKHHLLDVCHTSLSRIYTLPNIEISEAFLKLREQARCHYQVPSELQQGLEVINNTNLMYFSTPQKAEFFTLKGMFIAKIGDNETANSAFGQAVQMDLNMPKAWAEWGRYNDRTFKEHPQDMIVASNAVSCYLQAAGLYKNSKTRPLLIRILWFLLLDDTAATISRAFENFKGDIALWYWITLIPQLINALSHRAARHARRLLNDLARQYPQALFFNLRTAKDDFQVFRRQAAMQAARQDSVTNMQAVQTNGDDKSASQPPNTELPGGDARLGTETPSAPNAMSIDAPLAPIQGEPSVTAAPTPVNQSFPPNAPDMARPMIHPWDYVDEVYSTMKTVSPLLLPTLEIFVDNIFIRFKPSADEEMYRFIIALLQEGIYQYVLRNAIPGDDGSVPDICSQNVARLAVAAQSAQNKAAFEHDLLTSKPNMKQYMERLQTWRDRYERVLALRPSTQPTSFISSWLAEFQHNTYDEVEVPGQYLEHKDSSSHFVRISRLASTFEICRGNMACFRRLTFQGHDGTKHSFAVQHPSPRPGRREENWSQVFRIFNSSLSRRKESRKRNLTFHLPHAIPLVPSVRLIQNDATYVTLQDVYEKQCQAIGISKEDPFLHASMKVRTVVSQRQQPLTRPELTNLKMELLEEISTKMIPRTTLSSFFSATMAGPMELWLMRKQFTLQVAAMSFMTYIICLGSRVPSRIAFSKSTGMIHNIEVVPGVPANSPVIAPNEPVPFRLTPNMQEFMQPNGMEGLLTSGINAIARCLTEPEYDLEQQLGLFFRDEVTLWYTNHRRQPTADIVSRAHIVQNVDTVVRRAELLACRYERDNATKAKATAMHSLTALISTATNPQHLAAMPEQWFGFL